MPALSAASAATGFAGALFNPAVPRLILTAIGLMCAAALRSLRTRELLPLEPDTVRRGGRHRLRPIARPQLATGRR